jgi:SAM-dependent methyltransferase
VVGEVNSEPRLWRFHSDAINGAFLRRALGGRRFYNALKTDLFDEAIAVGLVPIIRSASASVTGIDLSPEVVQRARRRHPDLVAMTADIRRLPFDDGRFDLIVSISTLDHLANVSEIEEAIRELARLLAPGGTLALTMDNGANPAVALRNRLPRAALRRARLVAYPVGATVGPRRLEQLVSAAGLTTCRSEALMHCPRLPAVVLARLLERWSWGRTAFLRGARCFEALGGLPTRYSTGYFAAIVAKR